MRDAFDTVSQQSKRSFGAISKKSIKQIRKEQFSKSVERKQAVLSEITPSFVPDTERSKSSYRNVLQRKGSVGAVEENWSKRLQDDKRNRETHLL